jgi:hypothetical protein
VLYHYQIFKACLLRFRRILIQIRARLRGLLGGILPVDNGAGDFFAIVCGVFLKSTRSC